MNNPKIMSKALTSVLYIHPLGWTIYTFGVGYCFFIGLWVFGDTSEQIKAIVPTPFFIYSHSIWEL